MGMKKLLKGLIAICGVLFILGLGGCVLTMFSVGSALDETATEIQEESNKQEEAVKQVFETMEWSLVEDEFGFKTLESVIVNNTETKIDYIQFNVKFIKDGVVIETDWTNAVNIEAGESRKVEFLLVPDDYDSFEVTATNSALE